MHAARTADLNVTLNADTTVGSVIVAQNSRQESWADFSTSAASGSSTRNDRYVSVYPSVSGKPGMMRDDRAMRSGMGNQKVTRANRVIPTGRQRLRDLEVATLHYSKV